MRAAPRRAFALWPLAGALVLAAAAQAGEITTHLTGHVTGLHSAGDLYVASKLLDKGVSVGTPATLKLVIESGTTGVPVAGPPFDFVQYDHALTDLVITVGEWEAHLAAPPGVPDVNVVQVADDAIDGYAFDLWSGSALGVDTEGIVSNGAPDEFGTFTLEFKSLPPTASQDDGLVQNLVKYKTERSVRFDSAAGWITMSFDAPGSGGASDPTSLARQGQLKAAATLGQSLLNGLGKLAAAPPESDPGGGKKDALLLGSSQKFGLQFVAAIQKALKKGGNAPLGELGTQAATDYLMDGLQAQAAAITADADPRDAADRALRGKLLRALGAEGRAAFLAQAAHVKKPDVVKLAAALDKARDKLVQAVAKALAKATAQGLSYGGPDAAAMDAALLPFVNGFVELTATGVE